MNIKHALDRRERRALIFFLVLALIAVAMASMPFRRWLADDTAELDVKPLYLQMVEADRELNTHTDTIRLPYTTPESTTRKSKRKDNTKKRKSRKSTTQKPESQKSEPPHRYDPFAPVPQP